MKKLDERRVGYDKAYNKNRHHGNDSDFSNYFNLVVGCEAEPLSKL